MAAAGAPAVPSAPTPAGIRTVPGGPPPATQPLPAALTAPAAAVDPPAHAPAGTQGPQLAAGEPVEIEAADLAAEPVWAFGSRRRSRLAVEIAPDGSTAQLTLLRCGPDRPQAADLRGALVRLGVTAGLDHAAIDAALRRATDHGLLRGGPVIARARAPVPGEDGRLVYRPDARDRVPASGEDLQRYMQSADVREALAFPGEVTLVQPGDVVAEVVPPTLGTPGETVDGRLLEAPGRELEPVAPGDQVTFDGSRYVSTAFGYACQVGGRPSVLSPVWVSPDELEARLVVFPQAADAERPVAPESVMAALAAAGVVEGVLEGPILRFCSRPPGTRRHALLVARGRAAREGRDAHIDLAFDVHSRPGKVREDGSIDFRDRNLIVAVAANQVIGTLVAATPGEPGVTVRGQHLGAHDGKPYTVTAGENVRFDGAGENGAYVATADGAVRFRADRLDVLPVVAVAGDVGYETGHIDTQADVQIKGSVQAGFRVRSEGNVLVQGTVDNGALVEAAGDVGVSLGIVGANTRVVAAGSVECKFVQNSQVVAQGDIRVSSYIANAQVHAGGKVELNSGRGGKIVGGEVFGGAALEADSLGSAGGECTIVGLRMAPLVSAAAARLVAQMAAHRQVIDDATAQLGVPQLDAELVRRAMDRAPAPARASLYEVLKEAHRCQQELATLEAELQRLKQEQGSIARQGSVVVRRRIYADTIVEIGDHRLRLPQTLGACRFGLGDNGIEEHH